MANLGYHDLKEAIQLPANIDLTYLKRYSTHDNISLDRVVSTLGAAIVLFNRSIKTGYWANFISTTTESAMEYDTNGESGVLSEISEYGKPDPITGSSTGHMLPMKDFGGSLGWTYLALRRAKFDKLKRDVRTLIDVSRNTWEKQLLTAMFKMESTSVGVGLSVPFADGGVTDANYIPPSYDGQVFANTHDHYHRTTADAAGRTAALKQMVTDLAEHGVMSPYELLIPYVDRALWAAQTEFVLPERSVLITQGVEARARVDGNQYMGVLETDDGWFLVKPIHRLPTGYAAAFKVSGMMSPLNPLVVRYEEGFPLGLTIVSKETQFPLSEAIAYFTFGVGVANRILGSFYKFAAAGDYVTPVIS